MDMQPFIEALRQSWIAETSYVPAEWSHENPARGQCAVSSLVLQDHLGGDIRRSKTTFQGKRESHFYNVLENGEVFDATREQYPDNVGLEEAPVILEGFTSIREMLLNDADNARKYGVLRELVQVALAQSGARDPAKSERPCVLSDRSK